MRKLFQTYKQLKRATKLTMSERVRGGYIKIMERYNKTLFKINDSYEAVTIEQKIEKIMNAKEPIEETAPIIYTERKHGVKPEHNIRTDRFEVALEAMDKVSASHQAKRQQRIKESAGESEGEPIGQSVAE